MVVRIVDGDTFVVQLAAGRVEKVRLIGMDCPESKENARAKKRADESVLLPVSWSISGVSFLLHSHT
jgi:endonuclease YncB( thermonuclease family)